MEPNPPKNSFNLLYSNRVNARGRALNAAMSSLHSFDRSLDKFMAWLSDTESALESLELELDSYGPGVKTSRERVLMQLKVGISSVTQHQFRTSSTVIEWINNWRHISLIVSAAGFQECVCMKETGMREWKACLNLTSKTTWGIWSKPHEASFFPLSYWCCLAETKKSNKEEKWWWTIEYK
jgi:hypothetical protein